ncbi:MAG: (2Fe-2S)-binding protein [Pseudomonadota bacterium]
MIVCHCQSITDHEIHAAIDWMRASDAQTIITPGKIYHALGKVADCGGCLPLFLSEMRKNRNLKVHAGVPNLRDDVTVLQEYLKSHSKEHAHEGRSKGY